MYTCMMSVKQDYIKKFAHILIALCIYYEGSVDLQLHSKKGKSQDTACSPPTPLPKNGEHGKVDKCGRMQFIYFFE